ncbi:MAG: hypothetical protein RLZZ519_2362 [Bacteroidota bacterium]
MKENHSNNPIKPILEAAFKNQKSQQIRINPDFAGLETNLSHGKRYSSITLNSFLALKLKLQKVEVPGVEPGSGEGINELSTCLA